MVLIHVVCCFLQARVATPQRGFCPELTPGFLEICTWGYFTTPPRKDGEMQHHTLTAGSARSTSGKFILS